MVNISNSAQLVTPEQANIWLSQNYKYQRNVSSDQVEMYTQAMLNDQFAPTSVLMFSVLNGELHLINGQQTLHAIIKSKRPQRLPVVYYEVQSEKEEAELFFKIDRQRRRGFADSVRATGLIDSTGMTPTQIKNTAAALRYIKGGFGVNRRDMMFVSDDDLLEWVGFWTWEVQAIHAAITPCGSGDRNSILRQSVFSVALVTMRYQTRIAREFWKQVAQDDGLDRYDPRKTLRNWMKVRSGRDITNRVPAAEVSRAVALSWNAFVESRQLRYIIVRDATCLMRIKGTPYNGSIDSDWLPLYPSPHLEEQRNGHSIDMATVLR